MKDANKKSKKKKWVKWIIGLLITPFVIIVLYVGVIAGYIMFSDCGFTWLDVEIIKEVDKVCIQRDLPEGILYINDPHNSNVLVYNMKTYEVEDTYIYAINEHTGAKFWADNEDGTRDFVVWTQGGVRTYETQEEIPTYAKVNSENGDTEWFLTYDQMSKEDKAIFQELESNIE